MAEDDTHKRAETTPRLLRSTSLVSGMTLLSRVLGLVRDIVFARFFGAGVVMDAFFVAFKIPRALSYSRSLCQVIRAAFR